MTYLIDQSLNRGTGVYKIRNTVNNKFYIGSTSNSFRHRFLQHRSDFNRRKNHMPALYRAFEKYGFENFVFELVETCEKDKCIEVEQIYIDKGADYNSATTAGSMLGYKHPKNSKTKTVRGGNHHSAIPVFQFDVEGSFIKEFPSITDAVLSVNKNPKSGKSHIISVCQGKLFSSFGYRWSYDKQHLPDRPQRISGKYRVALSKKGFYREFESQISAAKFIGKKSCGQRISRSVNITQEIVYGFKVQKL